MLTFLDVRSDLAAGGEGDGDENKNLSAYSFYGKYQGFFVVQQ